MQTVTFHPTLSTRPSVFAANMLMLMLMLMLDPRDREVQPYENVNGLADRGVTREYH